MARPEPKMVTFEIDGREVTAPEGSMLVDAAKYGDVEIPVFCYEPKLGQPVGACRMCLVEIEGMAKLQTACSTAVKDGMVVVTTSEQVKRAQNAVVEFLLVNHALDCPVCDKGGVCPLQDISYGWGAGRSRFIEPTGTVCTRCPSHCNVDLTVRDDRRILRVNARDNTEVDDGWLCDKGRYGFQIFHAAERVVEPMLREGGGLRPVSWERAMEAAVKGLDRAGERTAATVGGEATNEEGFLLQFLMREVLGSPHIDSRAGGELDPEQARALARPDLTATVSDLDHAGAIVVIGTELVDESPILDLRVRKAVRRNHVPLVLVASRPSSLEPNADAVLRHAAGAEEAALAALVAELTGAEAPG